MSDITMFVLFSSYEDHDTVSFMGMAFVFSFLYFFSCGSTNMGYHNQHWTCMYILHDAGMNTLFSLWLLQIYL